MLHYITNNKINEFMPLSTPDGKPANNIDKIMLLSMWSKKLSEEKSSSRPFIISAGMGKPTFPVTEFAAQSGFNYWSKALSKSQKARHLLSSSSDFDTRNRIAKMQVAIDYGDPRGDFEARAKMALALNKWYGSKAQLQPQNVLYTVGGAGALNCIFTVLNKKVPNGLFVTPFPYYSLYQGSQRQNKLFPIRVMEEEGYRLTANALSKSLEEASKQAVREKTKISAVLICDPNNPLGTALDEDEWQKIAHVLKKYPDVFIILDEAYAEMRLSGKYEISLLSVAPKLKDKLIIMRSGTKALSTAGERMAVIVAFNDSFMTDLIQENVNIHGHSPRSLQYVFADAMESLDHIELGNLRNYYKPQVKYGLNRLVEMGAAMPKFDQHQVEGSFYIVADLKDLFGQEISSDATRALGAKGKIKTDEELIYSLLFDNGIAIAPLSYFGVSNKKGYVRITCSGGEKEINELMNRLEKRLIIARQEKQMVLEKQLFTMLEELNKYDKAKVSSLKELVLQNLIYKDPKKITALALKNTNIALQKLSANILYNLKDHNINLKSKAVLTFQSFFRGQKGRKMAQTWEQEIYKKWQNCVDKNFGTEQDRQTLYHWTPSKRLTFSPWVEELRKNKFSSSEEKPSTSKYIRPAITSKL